MPELPDVERARRLLDHHVPGARIDRVEVIDAGVVRNTTAVGLNRALIRRMFGHVDRRGKWLVLPTDGPTVLVHFGMTGSFHWSTGATTPDRFDRVVFHTTDGQLRYRDLRKLQGIWIADDCDGIAAIIGPQGPDALGLSTRAFTHALDGRRSAIKTVLMDQTVVAGLGNMLSDEVLWRSRIHPARRTSSLHPDEVANISRTMQRTLRAAVAAGRIPRTRTWLSSQRDAPNPTCPRCRAALRWTRIGGRSALWCPVDQPEPD